MVCFEETAILTSLGESIVTSNLHQLTYVRIKVYLCKQLQACQIKSINRFYSINFSGLILTRRAAGQVEKLEIDNQEGPLIFLLMSKSSKALHIELSCVNKGNILL